MGTCVGFFLKPKNTTMGDQIDLSSVGHTEPEKYIFEFFRMFIIEKRSSSKCNVLWFWHRLPPIRHPYF